MTHALVALAFVLLFVGCTQTSGVGQDATGAPCETDNDCIRVESPVLQCWFPVADQCAARGRCVNATALTCKCSLGSEINYCGCDGGMVTVKCCKPAGQAPQRVTDCTDPPDAGHE
jgi:hypothetical protein